MYCSYLQNDSVAAASKSCLFIQLVDQERVFLGFNIGNSFVLRALVEKLGVCGKNTFDAVVGVDRIDSFEPVIDAFGAHGHIFFCVTEKSNR